MIGNLPSETTVYTAEHGRTIARAVPLRAPGGGEVVLEVAGSALGAAPGAEISGTVIATGEAAADWLGRRVVVPRILPCGECDLCRRARTFACRARAERRAIARHETVPSRYLLSVEPPLWPEGAALWQLAALADALAAPYHALLRAQLGPGDVCIVVGAGVYGRLAVALARALGAHAVAVDADAALRERAAAAGARLVLDGERYDGAAVRAACAELAAREGLRAVEMKVIETTCTGAGRRRAVALLGAGDTAVLLAGGDESDAGDNIRAGGSAPLAQVAAEEAQVLGAHGCHPDLLPELAARLVRGDVDLTREVTPLPFDGLAEALAARRRGALRDLPILTP